MFRFAVSECLVSFRGLVLSSVLLVCSCKRGSPPVFTAGYAPKNALRVCTQNLYRLGENKKGNRDGRYRRQEDFLAERVVSARCDVLAVQELAGDSRRRAEDVLERFADTIERKNGRDYALHTARTSDHYIRNALLISKEGLLVEEFKDYAGIALPKLNPLAPSVHFSRGPTASFVSLRAQRSGRLMRFFFVTFHFKSKASSWKDPSKTSFELLRMEMAEGLRRLVEEDARRLGGDVVVILLGDRNSDYRSASVDILLGRRLLSEFALGGGCRLGANLESSCESGESTSAEFVDLFSPSSSLRPGGLSEGSYRFRDKWMWLDTISVSRSALPMLEDGNGRFRIGTEGRIYRGSDHLLLWAEFRF